MKHTYCYRIKELCIKLVIEISLLFTLFLKMEKKKSVFDD